MTFRGIQANPEHDGIMRLKLRQIALVFMRLDRASGRFVLRIEIKHHPFTAVIRKTDRRSILRGKGERRSLRSRLQIDIRCVCCGSVPGEEPQQSDQKL